MTEHASYRGARSKSSFFVGQFGLMQPAAIDWISNGIRRHFEAMDEELRLASRLQKEMLPPEKLTFGPATLSTLYRPCAWVSGDIVDIIAVDPAHVAFYLADVAGHGVAAGLLTMYVKHAVCPRRLDKPGLPPASPSEVLTQLNEKLVSERLRDSLFVTAWYGLLNLESMRLDYATAGHPPAIHVSSAQVHELHADGGLLGLLSGAEFWGGSIQLAPHDRVVVYTDGLEGVLIRNRPRLPLTPEWMEGIEPLLIGPTESVLAGVEGRLNASPGSLNKADDVTMIVLDV